MNDLTVADPEALAAYWNGQVAVWKHSGLSQVKFCQTHNLSYHRFGYWCRKIEGVIKRGQTKQDSGGFATVGFRPGSDSGLSLSLPNGLIVRGICADNVSVVRELLAQL